MADELLTEFATVEAAYGEKDAGKARGRLSDMFATFEKDFGAVPSVCARSPGRVNLIGEHIDYEGYGVLPMAIALDTVVAIRKNSSRDVITLRNTQSDTYGELTFPIDPDQHVDTGKHTWGNYVIGAYKGVFEFLKKHHPDKVPQPVGLDVLVDGQVPTGSGLSSSAAIVCSSAIAILEVHGVPRLRKGEVAEFTALAEQYVGVISGGMDQAISIMGKEGVAQLIEFNPVRASPVAIPDGSVFVIANSLTVSNKAESATGRYNLRVVECRLASAVLAKALGVDKGKAIEYTTLKEVEALVDGWCSKKTEALDQSMPNWCVAAVCDFLHEAPYSTREIEDILGCKLTELFHDEASQHVLDTFDSFKLHHRALHVYSEKQRVFDFAQICADTRYDADKARQLLGSLMDMSHKSCSTSYECSSPELDALVKVAKDHGALGSRLTGAGWGGCTVSLVKKDEVDRFLRQVKEQYYGPLLKSGRIDEASMNVTLFASPPASGGGILKNLMT